MPRNTAAWNAMAETLATAYVERRCYSPATTREVNLLRRHVAMHEVVEPFPRLFANASQWHALRRDEQERFIIRSYSATHPAAIFCSISSAVMHRLPVSFAQLGALHIYTDPARPTQSSRCITRHITSTINAEIVEGVPVSPLLTAAIECMCDMNFRNGLAVADATLRRLSIERKLLQEYVERYARGKRGVAMARTVAAYADGRAESGGESIARAIMIDAGLLPSDLQRSFTDPVEGWRTYRADFCFDLRDGATVIVEFDGKQKYTDEALLGERTGIDALVAERQRESRLTLHKCPIVRCTYQDLQREGHLPRLLAAAGVTKSTIAPPDYRATALKLPGSSLK